ncbi:MAG: ABC transporter permease [Candidatus Peribacteria bacterium]|jgi:putative ABC transport system permease protein|nr:ABC transporter permease [Candidatus Peribacteria bacterium]
MNIRQYVKEAFSTIKGNPLRSFLSILGIVIGIVSVVVMLGIGKGAEKKLMDELGELAKNQIQVLNYGGREGKKKLSLRKETINFLETMFPNISHKIGYSASHSETLPIKNSY